ncbi:MAG TPA: ABC transporter ATP-binding protein [Sandaracinaceae bacterium LLY-WYZ-13_1]|nr:ABC transporter ATP-binding protein [Sandaracinaceae bacterium LLY-WYZ-13_1]
MTETPHDESGPDEGVEWDWRELLTRLSRASGAHPDDDLIAIAARHAEEDADEPWTERLVRACEQLGMPASRLRGTVRQVASEAGSTHPVLARTADGGWLMLTGRRGGSVAVQTSDGERAEWRGRTAVAERVDPESLGAADWVAVDPPVYWSAGEPAAVAARDEPPTPWRRLRWLIRQERSDVAVVFVFAIGVGLLTLTIPIAVQALVNSVAFGALIQPLFVLTALLLAGLLFAGALKALEEWVVEVLQQRLFVHLTSDLSNRLTRVRLTALDAVHGPELMNRFFDLFTIQKSAALLLIGGIEIVLTALVGMIIIAFYHPFLLAFDVVLVAAVAVVVFVLSRGAIRTALQESTAKYRTAAWLEELGRSPGVFKLGGGPELARARSSALTADWLAARKGHFRVVYRQLLGALLLQAVASAALLGIGGWLVIRRELTLGQLVAAELIVTGIVVSLARAPKYLAAVYDLLAALDKVGRLVDLPMERPDDAVHAPDPAPDGSRVSAIDVGYTHADGVTLFEGASFSIAPGERVALVGPSGAGRSTLVDLLVGARPPGGGRIELDGVDLRDLGRDRLRGRVAAVRGPDAVEGTVAENVAFGRAVLSAADVREALREVALLDVVTDLSRGVKTRLTPAGKPLSRGQTVRLTLARALIGRPSLLVIERALDRLDDEALEVILPVVFGEDKPWTVIVTSDRPAVLRRCSRTLALRDGALSEVSA